jgi:hypothetical protein
MFWLVLFESLYFLVDDLLNILLVQYNIIEINTIKYSYSCVTSHTWINNGNFNLIFILNIMELWGTNTKKKVNVKYKCKMFLKFFVGARNAQKVQSHRASYFWIGSWASHIYFVVYSYSGPRVYNLHRTLQSYHRHWCNVPGSSKGPLKPKYKIVRYVIFYVLFFEIYLLIKVLKYFFLVI